MAVDARRPGEVPVFGSNGPVGSHDQANMAAPAILVGRKGSCGALTWTDEPGFAIDTVYYVDRSTTPADLRWAYWALHPLGLSGLSQDTGVPGLSREAAYEQRLPVPPPAEQAAIAAFLDRETGKIDALVEEQRRLIALLKEKRQAVISHAVTKGLNPHAPLKPSGIEWLGNIPAHWEVKAIKWLSPVLRGASPRPIDDPKYFDEDGEYAWVRIADATASDGALRETTQRLSTLGSSLSVRLEPGSLFVSIAGTVGKPCISAIKACIHDGFVYFPRLALPPQFLYRIFEAGTCYGGLGKMGTQLNLNTDTIGSIRVAVPPRSEMDAILAHLGELTGRLDALIYEANSGILLLQERRAALISAAVTGKIDVRGLVAAPGALEAA
ncbi:MAG: hypothetical protein KGZ61_03470 [Sandarakinorhabdus sp.]|nr:hypothetical protein [Sandarakinorhabdus sp.]